MMMLQKWLVQWPQLNLPINLWYCLQPNCSYLKMVQESIILLQDWILNQTNAYFELTLGVTLVTMIDTIGWRCWFSLTKLWYCCLSSNPTTSMEWNGTLVIVCSDWLGFSTEWIDIIIINQISNSCFHLLLRLLIQHNTHPQRQYRFLPICIIIYNVFFFLCYYHLHNCFFLSYFYLYPAHM